MFRRIAANIHFSSKSKLLRKPFTTNPQHNSTYNSYLEYEKKMMEMFAMRDKKKARQLIYGGIGIFTIFFISYEWIKSYFNQQAVITVNETLNHEQVIENTNKLAKDTTKVILEDPNTFKFVESLTNNILKDPIVQKVLKDTLYEIYEDDKFQQKTREFILAIITDEEFLKTTQQEATKVLSHSIKDIVDDQDTQKHVEDALINIINDNVFIENTYNSLCNVIKKFWTFK